MLEMLNYWVTYGVLTFLVSGFILFWAVEFLDYIIKDLTNGDFEKVVSLKWRNPFMKKIGFSFIDYTYGGESLSAENCNIWHGILFGFAGLVFWVVSGIIYSKEGLLPYQVMHNLTTNILPFTSWLLIPVVYFLVRSALKKGYQFIKKVNSVVEDES